MVPPFSSWHTAAALGSASSSKNISKTEESKEQTGQACNCVQVVWEVHQNRSAAVPPTPPAAEEMTWGFDFKTHSSVKINHSPTRLQMMPNKESGDSPTSASSSAILSSFDLYSFPTPEDFLQQSSEEQLRALGFGYRAR